MATNPELYQITLPSGVVYDIKDAKARSDIQDIKSTLSGGAFFLGATTTALSDGATTTTIKIGSADHTASKGEIVASGAKEYIFDGTKWIEFGDLGAFKALAYKDSASGSFTPAGNVTQPTFTGKEKSISVTGTPSGSITVDTGDGTNTYRPSGSVSKPGVTVTPAKTSITPFGSAGTLPSLSMTVQNENLSITFSQGTLPTAGTAVDVMTGATAALSAAPTFTGNSVTMSAEFTGDSLTSSGKFKPEGTVTKPTFSGTAGTVTVS